MANRHDRLWQACKLLPTDYEPWGERPNAERGEDCSCGCRFFMPLFDERSESWDSDWGVCVCPIGPRKGSLTFEHQGCPEFEG